MTITKAEISQNLIIFGATGGTGRHLVEQALEAGHHVSAFVRDPARLDMEHPRLRVVVGDVLDSDSVLAAMQGQDAVFSAIGAPPRSQDRLRARGTATIVQAMHTAGVSRLLSLSTYGIRDTAEELPFFLKWIIVPLVLRRAFDDHAEQEERVESSGLRWTLVRPPTLTDGPRTDAVTHGTSVKASEIAMKVSRADVAAFMLEELLVERYTGERVVVSS